MTRKRLRLRRRHKLALYRWGGIFAIGGTALTLSSWLHYRPSLVEVPSVSPKTSENSHVFTPAPSVPTRNFNPSPSRPQTLSTPSETAFFQSAPQASILHPGLTQEEGLAILQSEEPVAVETLIQHSNDPFARTRLADQIVTNPQEVLQAVRQALRSDQDRRSGLQSLIFWMQISPNDEVASLLEREIDPQGGRAPAADLTPEAQAVIQSYHAVKQQSL